MKRTLVDLEEADLKQLDELAHDRGNSRAAVLREAVAEYLVRHDRATRSAPKALEGFGALKGVYGDGLEYQTEVRAEWE